MRRLNVICVVGILTGLTSCKYNFHVYPLVKNHYQVDTIHVEPVSIKLTPVYFELDSADFRIKKLENYQSEAEEKSKSNFDKVIRNKFEIIEKPRSAQNIENGFIDSVSHKLDSVIRLAFQNCVSFTNWRDSLFMINGKVFSIPLQEMSCYQANLQIMLNDNPDILKLALNVDPEKRYYWLNFMDSDLNTKRERFSEKYGNIMAAIFAGILTGGLAQPGYSEKSLEFVKYYSIIYDAKEQEIIYFNFLTSEHTRGLFYPHPEKRRTMRAFVRKIKQDLPPEVVVVMPGG
jgi:hypothetical protein